jgi:hypothetical protein
VPASRKAARKAQKITTWIRQRTSPFCFGVKTIDGNPAHCNRNAEVLASFLQLRAGCWGRPLSSLKDSNMGDHFAGRKTFYFTADGRSTTTEVLVNIDIDCHRSGTLDGALAFARHLGDLHLPGLYHEASTNGNGVHGYLVVVKGDLGDEGLNTALGRLDRWLKHELSQGDWDVENVEVKGQSPEFTWGDDKYELRAYKSGQLAKLPREALSRADELRGTTRVSVDQLRGLRLPESDDSIVFRRGRSRGPRSDVGDQPEEARIGSLSGHHLGADELAGLKGSYLALSRQLLGETKLVATGRKVVTEDDMAVFLMLLDFFTKNMNPDGSLPTARWRAMWGALSQCGDVDRSWCHHRYATMRNFMSDRELLSWEDEGFVAGVLRFDGRFVPGKAAKWRASQELMGRMSSASGEEKGGSILYGCSNEEEAQRQQSEFEQVVFQGVVAHEERRDREDGEGESILYGCISYEFQAPSPTAGQSWSFLDFVRRLREELPSPRPRFTGHAVQTLRMAA